MKKRYLLPFLQTACFILISLLLQNCGSLGNLPLEGKEEPTEAIELEEQGRRKRARIETVEEEQEQSLIEQEESNTLPIIMPELWQEIFSYLDFERVLAARAVSAEWNKLITGFREAGIVGVENKTSHIIDARSWVKSKEIDFRNNKLKELTPATIPSFAFYYLMGQVHKLPQEFWPYLKGTNVHTLYLNWNLIGDAGASELAKALPDTRVHTLHLGWNQIGDRGAIAFAKGLQGSQMQRVDLRGNQIGDAGAIELAKALQGTQVHTLDLASNRIGDRGAIGLAKNLQSTNVHTVYVWKIGFETQKSLINQYPHIKWVF
jgi:hypothetical protein